MLLLLKTLPTEYQLELIDIQTDTVLKDKYLSSSLLEFYKSLNTDQYPSLKKLALKYVSIFGTTYMCEQTFSKMKYVKSKKRAALSDRHLDDLLILVTTKLTPQFDELSKDKQLHHWH